MKLNDTVKRTLILAYREDVSALAKALNIEGLNASVQRAEYNSEQLKFSRNSRCFLNHLEAWKVAAQSDGYTLICEADFVPCVGIGEQPIFWPDDELAWGYLYLGSPRLLALIGRDKWLRAHCAPLVAYVISPAVALILCKFFEDEMSRYAPTDYFNFDAHLQWYAMGQGAKAYMPMYHFGEHGGLPNNEHGMHLLPRAGVHRADNLLGPMHFLPQYAKGSKLRFNLIRLQSRLYGVGRLLSNRWVVDTSNYKNTIYDKALMYWVGMRRLMS